MEGDGRKGVAGLGRGFAVKRGREKSLGSGVVEAA